MRLAERSMKSIDGGLMRARGDLLYPIIDGIPMLLRDEAIEIDQFTRTGTEKAE